MEVGTCGPVNGADLIVKNLGTAKEQSPALSDRLGQREMEPNRVLTPGERAFGQA